MKIETENLYIRGFEKKDLEDLCEYMLQRVHSRFEAYPDFTAEKGKREIVRRCEGDEFYAVECKKNGKVIGNVYMGNRDFNARELGYVLNENYQRRGFGFEACKAILPYFFERGVHRIYAECAPENIASWRLLEKLGFRREAHLKKNIFFHTDFDGTPVWQDTYIYAILHEKEDYLTLV